MRYFWNGFEKRAISKKMYLSAVNNTFQALANKVGGRAARKELKRRIFSGMRFSEHPGLDPDQLILSRNLKKGIFTDQQKRIMKQHDIRWGAADNIKKLKIKRKSDAYRKGRAELKDPFKELKREANIPDAGYVNDSLRERNLLTSDMH